MGREARPEFSVTDVTVCRELEGRGVTEEVRRRKRTVLPESRGPTSRRESRGTERNMDGAEEEWEEEDVDEEEMELWKIRRRAVTTRRATTVTRKWTDRLGEFESSVEKSDSTGGGRSGKTYVRTADA